MIFLWVRKHRLKLKKGLQRRGKLLQEEFRVIYHDDWKTEASKLIPDWDEVEVWRR